MDSLNTRHFIHRHTQGVKRLSLGCGETHLLGLGKPELTLLMGFAALNNFENLDNLDNKLLRTFYEFLKTLAIRHLENL